MSIREANQNFSRLIKEVERGETVVITRQGKPVAQLGPRPANRLDDPEVRAAVERWCAHLDRWKGDGYRVGRITEDEKYGDADI
ncbi:MAG: type II toxin-antitoxin system prevent-host-death family antitoxin [Geminicoccaceae bacterium]